MTLNEIMMSFEIGGIYGIAALGIYLTLRVIDFPDLTCDGSFVLGAASSGILIKNGMNPWTSLSIAMVAGGLAGAATGIIHTKFRVTNLLSGILVGFMLYSINLRVMGGIPNISLMNRDTIFSSFPIVQILGIGLMSCAAITYLLMTDFGLGLSSIGQNKRLAKNSGVSISFMTITCLALSNSIIALSGALFSQHQGFSDVGSGIGTVMTGLASVMIGEKMLPYRSAIFRTISCLTGSILYRIFVSFALHGDYLGLNTSDLNLVTGLMILTVMYTPRKNYAKT
ncbi:MULTISPECIES: ABC transporter permease [Holospora]|uniref:ABC transporter permease n=2 Tax=Holospora TaxID=44747 RepID=A0A061JHQ2_9PROT|nr:MULTISPECIES: ABC transporter permease [Holospora]ETZ04908.1 hypothetical protein K737_300679 [Holospora undulata HU1]GAJ46444.1 putative protein RP368 [Holospora elegans E1]